MSGCVRSAYGSTRTARRRWGGGEPMSGRARSARRASRGSIAASNSCSRVLDERMHALEWSTGSSSMYYVMLVASLHSIEHCAVWARDVRQRVHARLPAGVASQWELDTIANSTPYGKAAGQRPLAPTMRRLRLDAFQVWCTRQKSLCGAYPFA